MANLLLLQDKLGEDFKSKRTRRASKALVGKLANGTAADSPGKDAPHMPQKYTVKEDDDKQVERNILTLNPFFKYEKYFYKLFLIVKSCYFTISTPTLSGSDII